MTLWTPLAVNYFRHPKVASIPPRARLLHLAGFCYCQEHTTDGYIPASVMPLLINESGAAKGSPGELVKGGLWCEVDGGWQVDSWHDWNRYASQIKKQRQGRKRGAEVTNHKRWHDPETGGEPDANCSLCVVASESLSESPHTHTQTQPPYPPRSAVDNSGASRVYDLRQHLTHDQLEAKADLGETS